MANSIAKLAIHLTADSTGLARGFSQAGRQVQQFGSQIAGMAAQLGLLAGGAGAAGFIGWGTKLAAEAETAGVAFRVMLGDADKAKKMLAEINTMALNTNLSGAGLRQSAQTLMGFGVAGENVLPVMRMLGDISLGNQDKFNSLALAFGQVAAAGRLMGQENLQLINSGFPVLAEISRKTGESMAELKKRMEAGGISAREVAEAFKSATDAGGRWHNMLNEMGQTLGARWAKLSEEVGLLAMNFAEKLVPAMKMTLAIGSQFVDWTSKISASTIRWGLSIGAALIVFPKVMGGLRILIDGLKALAAAQTLNQALAGPKGWGVLLGAGVITAGAVWGINAAFDGMTEKMQTQEKELQKLADTAKQTQVDFSKFNGGADPAQAAAAAAEERIASMKRQGAELAESLRTPFEKVVAELGKAKALWDAGAISGETWARAMERAKGDLAEQVKSTQKIRDNQGGPVAALQFGTQQAITAMNEARRQQATKEAVQKQELDEARKATALLQRAVRALEGDTTIQVNEVNL